MASERASLSALRHAMDSRQLTVHYQPVVDLESGRIVSVEALLRWTHDGVAVPPGSIVSQAEQSGLIVPLADYVMRTAVTDIKRLHAEVGGTGLRLSVNISPVQVSEGSLVAVDHGLVFILPGSYRVRDRLRLELSPQGIICLGKRE